MARSMRGAVSFLLRGPLNAVAENSFILRRFKQTNALRKAVEPKNILKWELRAAVCLTRLPLVSENLSELEEKYFKLLQNYELERSILSEWEIEKHRQDEVLRAIEAGEKEHDSIDFKYTKQDIEDSFDVKYKEFKSMELNTGVNDNDLTDVNRKNEESLTYIIQKKLGNDNVWVLPNTSISDDETMRECAERALSLHSLGKFQGTILSNAPCGYYKFKFPKEVRLKNSDDYVGAKIFIYSALLKTSESVSNENVLKEKNETETTNEENILSHAWVTNDELSRYLKPKYFEAVKKLLS